MAGKRVNTPYEKTAFFKFFEIYFSKFWKILQVNGIFFISLLLDVILIFGLSALLNQFGVLANNSWLNFLIFALVIPLGPIIAALTKLCRDFVREVPGFFWEDFVSALKANWKQSLVVSTFQYVITMLLYIALWYYNFMLKYDPDNQIFNYIGFGASLLVAVITVFMSYYLYMMVVTLDLRLRDIFKNALIFSFLCLPRNLLLTVVLAVLFGLTAVFLYGALLSGNALIWGLFIAYAALLAFGTVFYAISFFSFAPIKRFILDRYYEEHPEESSAGLSKVAADGEIKLSEAGQAPKEKSEYVYHNGKMVHRSAFEQEQLFVDKADSEVSDDV